ncbi:hypothetical protein GZH46_01269, partial [Fragariocoptes setiger]
MAEDSSSTSEDFGNARDKRQLRDIDDCVDAVEALARNNDFSHSTLTAVSAVDSEAANSSPVGVAVALPPSSYTGVDSGQVSIDAERDEDSKTASARRVRRQLVGQATNTANQQQQNTTPTMDSINNAPSVIHQVWTATSSSDVDELSPDIVGRLQSQMPFLAAYAVRPRIVKSSAPKASDASNPSEATAMATASATAIASPGDIGHQSNVGPYSAQLQRPTDIEYNSDGGDIERRYSEIQVDSSTTVNTKSRHRARQQLTPLTRQPVKQSSKRRQRNKLKQTSSNSRQRKNGRNKNNKNNNNLWNQMLNKINRKSSGGGGSKSSRTASQRLLAERNRLHYMQLIKFGRQLAANNTGNIDNVDNRNRGGVKGSTKGAGQSSKRPFYASATPRPDADDTRRVPANDDVDTNSIEVPVNEPDDVARRRLGNSGQVGDDSVPASGNDNSNVATEPSLEPEAVSVEPKYDGVDDDPDNMFAEDEDENPDGDSDGHNRESEDESQDGGVKTGDAGGQGDQSAAGDDENVDDEDTKEPRAGRRHRQGKTENGEPQVDSNGAGESTAGFGGGIGATAGQSGQGNFGEAGRGSGSSAGREGGATDFGPSIDNESSDDRNGNDDADTEGDNDDETRHENDQSDISNNGKGSGKDAGGVMYNNENDDDDDEHHEDGDKKSMRPRDADDRPLSAGNGIDHNDDTDSRDTKREFVDERTKSQANPRERTDNDSSDRESHERTDEKTDIDDTKKHHSSGGDGKHCDDGHYDEHAHHNHDGIKWLQDSVPGEPGTDYPIYSQVPHTKFSCGDQKYPGYYSDVEARCQAFHVCQANGSQESFLCPNGTIFSQQTFVCVWWNSFNCDDATALYERNEQLYQSMLARRGSIDRQSFADSSGINNIGNSVNGIGPEGGLPQSMLGVSKTSPRVADNNNNNDNNNVDYNRDSIEHTIQLKQSADDQFASARLRKLSKDPRRRRKLSANTKVKKSKRSRRRRNKNSNKSKQSKSRRPKSTLH